MAAQLTRAPFSLQPPPSPAVIPRKIQKFLSKQFKTYILTKVDRDDNGRPVVTDNDVKLFEADGYACACFSPASLPLLAQPFPTLWHAPLSILS